MAISSFLNASTLPTDFWVTGHEPHGSQVTGHRSQVIGRALAQFPSFEFIGFEFLSFGVSSSQVSSFDFTGFEFS